MSGRYPPSYRSTSRRKSPTRCRPGRRCARPCSLPRAPNALGCIPFSSRWRPTRSNTTAARSCNNCGFCSGYGCPVSAKPVNLIALRRALQTGRVNLRPLTQVLQVNFTGRKATGVSYVDASGQPGGESADVVVLACSAILTPHLALLSGLPDPYGRIGKRHHVSELLRRVRRLPQPAGARLQGPLVHAGRVRLQRSRLPRGSSRRTIGPAALHPRRPVRARREPVSDRGGQLLPEDPWAAARGCSFSAARSRS